MIVHVNFKFKGKEYNESFDSSKIDRNHYENIWDWWFNDESFTFELNADYGLCGEITNKDAIIFVYPNEDDDFSDSITDVNVTFDK